MPALNDLSKDIYKTLAKLLLALWAVGLVGLIIHGVFHLVLVALGAPFHIGFYEAIVPVLVSAAFWLFVAGSGTFLIMGLVFDVYALPPASSVSEHDEHGQGVDGEDDSDDFD